MLRLARRTVAGLSLLTFAGACSGGGGAAGGSQPEAGPGGDDAAVGSDAAAAGDAGGASDTGGVGKPDAGNKGDAGGPSSCGAPFSRTGPWCYKLPASTPIATNSAAIVANIKQDIQNNYGTIDIGTNTYSTPIYTVAAGTPTQAWSYCMGSAPSQLAPALASVPTTSSMVPSMGTDSEIAIYDPAADQEWEFWQATSTGGQWSACWGGTIQHVSTDPGIFPPPTGAVACGLPLLGFVLRISELQAGLIQHAMNIVVVRTQATNFSWPANRTDGNTAGLDLLMEGQRVRLDPSFDVSTLPNAAERTIARAMQDYGMILTDTSGSVGMQAEDSRPYMAAHNTTTDPYDAIFGGPGYAVIEPSLVDHFQVLPQDYGKTFMH